MMFDTFCKIDKIVKQYTEAYELGNSSSLNIVLIASVTDEEKEFILNDLDYYLRDLIHFSHTYDNGRLQIIFN